MISSGPIIDCTESKQYVIYAADIPSTNLFLDEKIFIKDFGVFLSYSHFTSGKTGHKTSHDLPHIHAGMNLITVTKLKISKVRSMGCPFF